LAGCQTKKVNAIHALKDRRATMAGEIVQMKEGISYREENRRLDRARPENLFIRFHYARDAGYCLTHAPLSPLTGACSMATDLVSFWVIQNGKKKKIFGHLVRHPDGSLWCFQDEKNAAGDPFRSGTIRLDDPDSV
jgi:hypothetical protein